MNLPAAEQRGIFRNYFLFAASGGEFNPKEIKAIFVIPTHLIAELKKLNEKINFDSQKKHYHACNTHYNALGHLWTVFPSSKTNSPYDITIIRGKITAF